MKKTGLVIFLLLIFTMIFSNSHNATTTSDKKNVIFHHDNLISINSVIHVEADHKKEFSFSAGIYQVEIKSKAECLTIPIYVDQDPQQDFYLFGPEDLTIKLFLSNEAYQELRKINLSAVSFGKIGMSLIGKRTVILESEAISKNGFSFHIVNPIFNTSVENFILSVVEEENRYEKYLILDQGILSFLKGVETISIEEEDKKISLFESEWVAQNRQVSAIVYRDEVQDIKSTVIKTLPANSDLYIGNEFLGHTPYELFLKEDVPVFITVKHEGYFDQEIKLIRAELEPEQIIKLTQMEDGGVQF